jgi:hypothetical protein
VPVWAWVVVTLIAGIGSGLLGTLVRISHDRQAEVRHQALMASQEFASLVPQWIAILNEAVTARWNDAAVPPEESEPAYEAAVAAIRDARASLYRLLVALPQRSSAARSAITVVDCLAAAIEELRVWSWSEREEALDIGDPPEDWSAEDEADYQAEAEEELIAEAKMCCDLAERALGDFIFESAGELRAGLGAELQRARRRIVFVTKTPHRILRNWRTGRVRRAEAAAFEARLARLRERQSADTP